MINVQDVRKRYPSPVSASVCNFKGEYCIGGALCKYMEPEADENYMPFPRINTLAAVLIKANPKLGTDYHTYALYFSREITKLNDHHNFDEAWKVLEEALTYGHDE